MDQLILGDSLPHLEAMETKSVPLGLTDPPYGINIAKRGKVGSTKYARKLWDTPVPPAYFTELLRVCENVIIWGGNYYTNYLPPSRCWLVWFKKDGLPRNSFADCELAWTSFNENAYVFNCRHAGFIKDSREKRVGHPTQKALEVMKWCIRQFSEVGDVILDPFLGSGTTAVAARLLSRRFIGIEKDPDYFRMATERINGTNLPNVA